MDKMKESTCQMYNCTECKLVLIKALHIFARTFYSSNSLKWYFQVPFLTTPLNRLFVT